MYTYQGCVCSGLPPFLHFSIWPAGLWFLREQTLPSSRRNHTIFLFLITPFKPTEHQHLGITWNIRETAETNIALVVSGLLPSPQLGRKNWVSGIGTPLRALAHLPLFEVPEALRI